MTIDERRLLELDHVTVRFGGLVAVNDVTFSIKRGEIVSLIGPNGAGKTTVFNSITGLYKPSSGRVLSLGEEMKRPFTLLTALMTLGGAIFCGLALTLLVNIITLWESTITAHYIYLAPFPWGEALRGSREVLMSGSSYTMVPFLIGFSLAAFGVLSLWRSASTGPDIVTAYGVIRTFQNIRLFGAMSVIDNVLVGMSTKLHSSFLAGLFRTPSFKREKVHAEGHSLEILKFVGLVDEAFLPAHSLSYGHQRRLEIARALASEPKLLLLDEPAAGMNPAEASSLMDLIRRIRERGVTVILIEHHMKVVMGISDRIVVLDYGNKIAEGTPQEIKENPRVIEAYLGQETLFHG